MTRALLGGLVLCLAVNGCAAARARGDDVFSTNWQDDHGASIGQLEARLQAAPKTPNASVAVGLTERGLLAVTLDTGARWSHAAALGSLPQIAGPLVIVAEGDQIVALDAQSGNKAWSVASGGLRLRGAANDGERSVLVLAGPDTYRVIGVSKSGSVLSTLESATPLGHPAVRGGIAFVPWSHQYVSAIELDSGRDSGRVLFREQTSQAVNFGGEIYFGERALTRFDDKISLARTNQAVAIALPPLSLPGNPEWLGSGETDSLPQGDARTKIRIYAAPATKDTGLTFGGGTFAASYFRVIFGLDANTSALRWVRVVPADVVGGAAAPAGFYFCDGAGTVWSFDQDGGEGKKLELGEKITACSIDAGSGRVSQASAPAPPLVEQLSAALDVLTPDMAVAQRYLLTELGRQADPIVTKSLIDLASSPRLPGELRTEARNLLARRAVGADYMLAALEHHFDFVSGELPPPVGPLADALAASGEMRAAPLLAKHLNDPSDSTDDVARAARALKKLASPAELDDLRTFFALYRATADDDSLVQAVLSVAATLLRIGGDVGRAQVERATQDPLTQEDVRRALPALLATQVPAKEGVPAGAPPGQPSPTSGKK
ncbi:MAG TPA: PQQ-binding-like beta-propeller repeat protein [Polyangiaceae bacterium]